MGLSVQMPANDVPRQQVAAAAAVFIVPVKSSQKSLVICEENKKIVGRRPHAVSTADALKNAFETKTCDECMLMFV